MLGDGQALLDSTLGESASPRAVAAVESRRKRLFDVVAGAVLLVIATPIALAIAIAIRVSSPGPVLFRQERIGLNGARFTVLKFRTMRNGVSHQAHEEFVSAMIAATPRIAEEKAVYKLQNDPRTTRVGRWLRRTSLDEVPQLINVLAGEMSIVGPRPPLEYEVAKYEPWQIERLSVRPGITGLWQVSGRNRLSYRQMCEIDIRYARTWTFAGDVKIALRTPWAMWFDRGGLQ